MGKSLLQRLRDEACQEWKSLLLGSIALVGSSMANQTFPRLLGKFMDQSEKNTGSRKENTQLLIFVVVGGGLASFTRTTVLGWAESGISTRLRQRLFASLLSQDLEWFEVGGEGQSRTPASLVEVLRDDVAKIANNLTSTIANGIRSTSSVVLSTIQMLSINPSLFGVACAVIPAVGAAAMLFHKALKRTSQQQRDLANRHASFVEERLINTSLIQLSKRREDEVLAHHRLLSDYLQVSKRHSRQQGFFMGFIFTASASALFLVMNYGGQAVAKGKMTSGQLTSFTTYSFLMGLGTGGVVKAASEFGKGMVSAERVYSIIDEDPKLKTKEVEQQVTDEQVTPAMAESISFDSVSFCYRSRPEVSVLKEVSFKLPRGKVVALVGKNGSGKSTVASLLSGLLKPTSGRIILNDDENLSWSDIMSKETSTSSMLQIVLQTTSLFNSSLFENVRYCEPNATKEEVRAALTRVNGEYLLEKYGFDFELGWNGSKLSGGERQRLALARAMVKDPAFLVFDEPINAMDADGEEAIVDAIEACRRDGRALLLITHQPKSLRYTDEVIVLGEGRILESGSFKDLQANKSSQLYRLMPEIEEVKI